MHEPMPKTNKEHVGLGMQHASIWQIGHGNLYCTNSFEPLGPMEPEWRLQRLQRLRDCRALGLGLLLFLSHGKVLRSPSFPLDSAGFSTLGPVARIRLKKKKKIPGVAAARLGPMAAGGGKQPTFRTARAQRTVRPHGLRDTGRAGLQWFNLGFGLLFLKLPCQLVILFLQLVDFSLNHVRNLGRNKKTE